MQGYTIYLTGNNQRMELHAMRYVRFIWSNLLRRLRYYSSMFLSLETATAAAAAAATDVACRNGSGDFLKGNIAVID